MPALTRSRRSKAGAGVSVRFVNRDISLLFERVSATECAGDQNVGVQAPFWFCLAITSMSAFVSFGFSVAAVVSSSKAAKSNALYACSRSVALALICLVPIVNHSIGWLSGIAVTMILVQFGDAIIGHINKDLLKTVGPAFTATFNLAALIWLLRSR